MLRRVESHLPAEGSDTLRIFRRSWLPERPTRSLLLVHGYAEHSGRYEHVGRWFAERGYAVHAYDHRGHGRSEGLRCHVDRFDEYLDDLDRMVAAVRESHPELPLSMLGHSMGGLISTAFVAERRPGLTALVTSGAALSVPSSMSRARLASARLLRRVAPRFALGSGLDPDGLSRDPEVVSAYLNDPHVHRTMTTSLAVEVIEAIQGTAERAFDVQVPMLLLHGEDDPLCAADGSRAFHAGLHAARSGLRIYPGLRHEILNEPEGEQVMDDVHDWLSKLGSEVESVGLTSQGGAGA